MPSNESPRPPAADEAAWLSREALRHRRLAPDERIAAFRDLEACVRTLAGDRLPGSKDGEKDPGVLWRDPSAGRPA